MKPYKIWVNQGCEFYNRPSKTWLDFNDTEMYSMHNERKSVITVIFIRTLNIRFIGIYQLCRKMFILIN